MKKILLLLLIFCVQKGNAQLIRDWKDISDDSAVFVNHFGSVNEYNYQHSSLHSNGQNFKAHLIDTRPFWVLELGYWLIHDGFCAQKIGYDFNFDKNVMNVDFIGCGVSSFHHNEKITVTASFGENSFRTKKVTIIGDPDVLIHLFVYYWEDAAIRLDKFKRGYTIYQDYGDDRISFEWLNNKAKITVTKNPHITFFRLNLPMDGMVLKD